MYEDTVQTRAFAMPLTSPAYPIGPYRFRNRKYLIITYRQNPEKLRELVPEPLQVEEPLVKFEFIRVPGLLPGLATIPKADRSSRSHSADAKALTAIACSWMVSPADRRSAGAWGFPKKLANPTLGTEIDTLVGTLDYGPVRVATATMGC